MNKEEFKKQFGESVNYTCQRFSCCSNENHGCKKKHEYPCPKVLPTYILTVFEKRWERYQNAIRIKEDTSQGRLW